MAAACASRWNDTLFIVNFDEHGGTYDHVAPPWNAAVPWGGDSATPAPTQSELGFGFDRYGVRVPLILVSPYIEANTVFRAGPATPFDHASVIATILTMTGIPRSDWKLGNRVQNAPTFEWVLTRSAPRTDTPRIQPSAAALAAIADDPPLDPPPSGLQREIVSRMLREYLSRHAPLQPLAGRSQLPSPDEIYRALDEVQTMSALGALVTRVVGEPPPR